MLKHSATEKMAEQLTLESLGVDLPELARRIAAAQDTAGRDDETCAELAGVTVERWQAWKDNRERPGVGRIAKIAAAVSSTPPALMFGVGVGASAIPERSTDRARRAAAVLGELAPHVDALVGFASEIERGSIPIAGGDEMAHALRGVADVFANHAAVASWEMPAEFAPAT